jgi:tetratricopeptide (TPR) repeat protein
MDAVVLAALTCDGQQVIVSPSLATVDRAGFHRTPSACQGSSRRVPFLAMASVSSLVIARFMRLPRRASDTWQGGPVRMPLWVGKRDEEPRRAWGAVWLSLETDLVNVKLVEGTADWQLALEALTELGLRFARTRPACLEVADRALAEEIVRAVGDRELAVKVSADIPMAKDRVRQMAEYTQGGPLPPDALGAKGVTVERMRAFAVAARQFYEAAPWRHLSDEDLIRIEAPAVDRGLSLVTVLGAAGQTFGLGFFGSPREFEQIQGDADPEAFLGRRGKWSLLYGPIDEMPFGDVDLWEDHGLPVARRSAYPVAMWFGPDGELRRPEARTLTQIEAILGALARTSEDEIDRGRWSHDVATADGPKMVTLAIPELLRPLDAPPDHPGRGMPDRRVMERLMLEVDRFAAARSFESAADLAAAIQQRFSGPIDEIASTSTTPLERAQDLAYRAVEARGRRRLQLARRALELSPDCVDAYVLLAEEARGPEEARDLYVRAVEAGERVLGEVSFTDDLGHFWEAIRTRPYMRARFGLAQCLEDLGQRDEAIHHYRELIRLNPGDNQGVRYVLVAALLHVGQDAEAGALLERYGREPTALWSYSRALHAFRREGDARAAREELRRATRVNRHVAGYLQGRKTWPGPLPASYGLGTREEAAVTEDLLGELWRATPGADRWLAAHASTSRSGKRRRR